MERLPVHHRPGAGHHPQHHHQRPGSLHAVRHRAEDQDLPHLRHLQEVSETLQCWQERDDRWEVGLSSRFFKIFPISGRDDQPDVPGRPEVHGPDALPQHGLDQPAGHHALHVLPLGHPRPQLPGRTGCDGPHDPSQRYCRL